LYVAISNYDAGSAEQFLNAARGFAFARPIVNQCRYNFFQRGVDENLLQACQQFGVGVIGYSPLAQGLLSNRYVEGIPPSSRAARQTWDDGDLKAAQVTDERIQLATALTSMAQKRGQSLAQMAISWCLRDWEAAPPLCSVIIGASSVSQLSHNLTALHHIRFTPSELADIEQVCRTYVGNCVAAVRSSSVR
jgi:L-glyceraldehyde 3-phosphate reductase